MKLVTIDAPPDGRTGVLIDDEVLDFAIAREILPLCGWVPVSMAGLLAGGDGGLDLIRRQIDLVRDDRNDERARLRKKGALRALKDTPLMAPVPRPGILLSHGRAYHSHLNEMAKTSDGPPKAHLKPPEEPKAFMKNPNQIIGPGAPIELPRRFPDKVDFEGEFSIVFGRDCHDVEAADAMKAVAGYTLINDVSARDWVEVFLKTGDMDSNRQGKQLPSFCPMGPVLVTKDEIPDPHNVALKTILNGQVMQDAHTSDLIWPIAELIAYFASFYPFRAGDILTTGSPAGVGFGRKPQVFMKPGDVIEVRVDAIGVLSNPIVAPAR